MIGKDKRSFFEEEKNNFIAIRKNFSDFLPKHNYTIKASDIFGNYAQNF